MATSYTQTHTSHNLTFIDTKAPTCSTPGIREVSCASCEYNETQSVATMHHADANGDGVCDECNAWVNGCGGDYLFTVCDGADWSGERLDLRENIRGTTNSENDAYREEQLDWLASLEPGDEAFHFAALHIPNFGNEAQRDRFYNELTRLGVDMQFSGNEHALYLDELNAGSYAAPYPLFIAGGPKDGSYGGLYVCSMAQVCADGSVHLLAYDSANEKLMDETIRIIERR